MNDLKKIVRLDFNQNVKSSKNPHEVISSHKDYYIDVTGSLYRENEKKNEND